jgi:hypothetical protein
MSAERNYHNIGDAKGDGDYWLSEKKPAPAPPRPASHQTDN